MTASITRSPHGYGCTIAGRRAAAVDFASLAEFYEECDMFAKEHISPWRRRGMWEHMRKEAAHFTGATRADIAARRWGWSDGLKEIERLPVPEILNSGGTWRRTWSDDDGDEWDHERAMNEMPMLRRRVRAAHERTGSRYCTIIVNVGELCNKTWRDMLFKAFAVARVADTYETSGIRCKIVVISPFVHDYYCGRTSIVVKRHDEPLNVALLLNVTSPWFFRGEILVHRCSGFFDMGHHAGSTLPLVEQTGVLQGLFDERERTIILETNSVLDYKSAAEWIQNHAAV